MSRDERERLRDIRDAILAIRSHLERIKATEREINDPLLHDALLFQFVVIGEAVKHLTSETRDSSPEIPWADIAGLRDLIAHEYFRIEMKQILDVVEHDLAPLEKAINGLSRRVIGVATRHTRVTLSTAASPLFHDRLFDCQSRRSKGRPRRSNVPGDRGDLPRRSASRSETPRFPRSNRLRTHLAIEVSSSRLWRSDASCQHSATAGSAFSSGSDLG